MWATNVYIACAMMKVSNQGFDMRRNPECVPRILWRNPMPGTARSDMGLGRISMFLENPMPSSARSDKGLGRVWAVLALMKSANWSSSALIMNA